MSLIVRALALFLLVVLVAPHKTIASSVPWCAPTVAVLFFSDQAGQRKAKVELRAAEPICSDHGAEKSTGVALERTLRIEHNGQSIEVPKLCLAGVSFRIDDISLTIDDVGVGIMIIGKSTGQNKDTAVTIYKIRDKVLCSQDAQGG